MSISSLFIKRPVMTTLVMIAIFLVGAQGYMGLPVNDLPNVDFPTIAVSASLPGAGPETMASSVAMPLERQFSTIAGIDSMSSVSYLGSTQITIQFSLDRDIDAAAQDVQSAISAATRSLPRDMPAPPSYRKVNPADSPILFLALSSPVLPLSDVDEYGDTNIAQRVSMVNGVAQVQVYGSQKYAVRVWADPQALAARKLGMEDLLAAIQTGNVNMPTGDLQGAKEAFTIETESQLENAADYEPLVVAWRNGAPVRLGDVARVRDSVENDRGAGWYNRDRAVVLAVQRQPGSNTVRVVDDIMKLLPEIRQSLPASVGMDLLYDRSQPIRESVADVKHTFVLTTLLVVLVIFLFLRKITATIIPAFALILSVVGTFGFMAWLGHSLDNLSLMALTLSVGFVVDDAIVMLENIVRHIENGEPPMEAAHKGAGEIGFTILSMTISLVAVFIPVLFMGGIAGRLLNEFAVVISIAILMSGVISLTQTPMLCSRLLRQESGKKHGPLYRALEWGFDAMLWVYDRTLRVTMRHRFLTVLTLIPLLWGTAHLFKTVPKGFLPTEDTGQLMISTEGAQGISFADMVKHQRALADILLEYPHIDGMMCSVGSGGMMGGSNSGRFFIRLKPRDQRPPVTRIVEELRPKLATVPGIRAFPMVRPAISIGGQATRSLYQFTLQSTDTALLYEHAPKLEERMRALPGLVDVNSDLFITNPQVEVEIDRDKASSLGISAQKLDETLYTAFGSRQISTIYAPNNQYRVILELAPEHRADPAALGMLYVRSATGAMVPLDTVATLKRGVGPLSVTHLGQIPSVTLSFNLKPGAALGDAQAAVQRAADEMLPQGITTSFQGTAQAFQSSMGGMAALLIAAVLVIYIVLGILYESFIHPVTILSSLPSAGVGALLTLQMFGMELNIFSLVGVIMLVGIVKKNGIMMIDFAVEAQREKGLEPAKAIYDACLIRFRPIMMTTMTTLAGTLPIALGMGAGSESRRPLGMAVVGGLIVSQLLTLYITPVLYTYMESLTGLFRRRPKPAPAETAAETTP